MECSAPFPALNRTPRHQARKSHCHQEGEGKCLERGEVTFPNFSLHNYSKLVIILSPGERLQCHRQRAHCVCVLRVERAST